MRLTSIIHFLFFLFCFEVSGQTIYYQDTWQGGIVAAGANIGGGSTSSSHTFSTFIESNSTIKKAFLVAGSYGTPQQLIVSLNSNPIVLDSSTEITSGFLSFYNSLGYAIISVADITNIVSTTENLHSLIVPAQESNDYGKYVSFYLIILYENNDLPNISAVITLNNQNVSAEMNYLLIGIDPINSSNDVGFAFAGWAFCDTIYDGTYVSIENNILGLVGGNDYNANFFCSGTQGHFYFQNNTLFGIEDDNANEVMGGPDAIANIQNYVVNNANSLNIDFNHQSPFGTFQYSNPVICAVLAYTSPCQPFPHSLLTSDTTTCANTPLQLGASGGITYNWLPQTNLSCYDCPNPVFLGDSTINYTVRIWSTDSCSVVQPVRVRVAPQPNFESIDVAESICGFSNGTIAGTSAGLSVPHTYQLNDGVPQNNFSFSNMAAGAYTITVTDANGCSQDSTVQITEINNVQAAFSVNPSTGAAPLTVQTQNNSQNATQNEWSWADESSTLTNPSILLDTAGVYTLTLVASNGAAYCNDTASMQIFVKEPFVVFAYTVVTDEAEFYQIFLSGVAAFRYKLYDAQGKLVYKKNGQTEAAEHINLWEISQIASGLYFYKIWVKDNQGQDHEVDGKLVVVR